MKPAERNKQTELIYRVLDANLNRAKEGLRVSEDTIRFMTASKNITSEFKRLRHNLDLLYSRLGYSELIASRNVSTDAGRNDSRGEICREDISAILIANMQRAKESLRVIEEFLKLIDPKLSRTAKNTRYGIYALERMIWGKIGLKINLVKT